MYSTCYKLLEFFGRIPRLAIAVFGECLQTFPRSARAQSADWPRNVYAERFPWTKNRVSEGYARPRDLVPLAIYERRKSHKGIFNILLVRSGCCTRDTVFETPQRRMRNESTYMAVLSCDVRRYRSDTLHTTWEF